MATELQLLLCNLENVDGPENIKRLENAILSIKSNPRDVYVGLASITSYNIEPIVRILCTNIEYHKLSLHQRKLLLCLWNYFRRRIFTNDSSDSMGIDRNVYSDFLGLCGLEMLFAYVLPGSLESTRPRLGMKWLQLSLYPSHLQRLAESIDLLLEAIHLRKSTQELSLILPSFHSIRLLQLEGWTILHVICANRNLSTEKLIKEVLHSGLDSSVQDSYGRTALHIAATHFNWIAVNALTVLVPTSRSVADKRGDIPLVSMLRAIGITAWSKFISPERLSSLIGMLTPSKFISEIWSFSTLDRSLCNLFIYSEETLFLQLMLTIKREVSFSRFQTLLFYLLTCIAKRRFKVAMQLFRTATELLPAVLPDLMRNHGDTVTIVELSSFFLDLVLGISLKFSVIDIAVEVISALDSLFHSQQVHCRNFGWCFPYYALVVSDAELLRSALDKFSPEAFSFFFTHQWPSSSVMWPSAAPLKDMFNRYLLQESQYFELFHRNCSLNTETVESKPQLSIAELACALHVNTALQAICKSAQRAYRELDSNWVSLQHRCLCQALYHQNWKAVDLIRILHDSLFSNFREKRQNSSMTLDPSTTVAVCRHLASFLYFDSMDAQKTAEGNNVNEDIAQCMGRLLACFPPAIPTSALQWSSKCYNHVATAVSLTKSIYGEMNSISDKIHALLLSIRALGPGGSQSTPIFWTNHLQEEFYREIRNKCLENNEKIQSISFSLHSSLHGATLRRISRYFVPDMKWKKFAYTLVLYMDCIENAQKLLESSADYDDLTDKQWSRVETMLSSATKSPMEFKKWCSRLLNGLNFLSSISSSQLSSEQLQALEFFVNKYQNINNLRYVNRSNKNLSAASENHESVFPSKEKLQALKRENRATCAIYDLYDQIFSQFGSVVAPQVLNFSRESPSSRQNQSQHLTNVEYVTLFYLDKQYQRLSDFAQQLILTSQQSVMFQMNDIGSTEGSSKFAIVEGDFLQIVFGSSTSSHISPSCGDEQKNFLRDIQFYAGQKSSWAAILQTLSSHQRHQRNATLLYNSATLLDEAMTLLVQRCTCSPVRLLSYLHLLTANQCFQAATVVLQRFHESRLKHAFSDWNIFHQCYLVGDNSSFQVPNVDTVRDIPQQMCREAMRSTTNSFAILSPIHFALQHNKMEFVCLFFTVFPHYPVNLHSLAWFTDRMRYYAQWEKMLPILSQITQVQVTATDIDRLESYVTIKKLSALNGQLHGSHGDDLSSANYKRSTFLTTWEFINNMILSIRNRMSELACLPTQWLSHGITRQECDFVTKTAKLYAPSSASLQTASQTVNHSSDASVIRLMAMMDGTWMSYDDVTSQFHNYMRALPAPVIIDGHGTITHSLCAYLSLVLDENDEGRETFIMMLNKLPDLTKLFFVRMSKFSPSPLYILLQKGKYSLAQIVMQGIKSNQLFHSWQSMSQLEHPHNGLLRQHVLSTLEHNLKVFRGMFPVPEQNCKVENTAESLSNTDIPSWTVYLASHRVPTELTFCASCLEYSQDLWRRLINSSLQPTTSESSSSGPLNSKAFVFTQHAGRVDLLKYDSVVRARQVLSILQIPFSVLVPAANITAKYSNLTAMKGATFPQSFSQNPDLLFLSPSYLCRRVTSSMYHQLKLLLTGWLHPKLRHVPPNKMPARKLFASLQVIDDVLLFHNPAFTCFQYLSEELRQYQSATVLDKENVINSYLAQQRTSSSTGIAQFSKPFVGSASNSPMIQLVRPDDWAALDTISYSLLILEYARSLCIARMACVVSYPEEMTTWIPSSYVKHPLTVIRRQIATLTEDIAILKKEEETSAKRLLLADKEILYPPVFMSPSMDVNRGLRSRIGLLDRVSSEDVITFLQYCAVYSPRLKRLRDVLVTSLSAMLTDLGLNSAGKMIVRLEKKMQIPGYRENDENRNKRNMHLIAEPSVFSSAFESDVQVLSEEILPVLRSLRILDFWQTGSFPLFRHTFESIMIDSEQDLLVDMVHSLKQGHALSVSEEEESAIYYAFQHQSSVDIANRENTTKSLDKLSTQPSVANKPRQGFVIPHEIAQTQRLYSKSAMDTVHRLRQALHVASQLYWFVGSCYGLIVESRTSTLYDDDIAVVLDVFNSNGADKDSLHSTSSTTELRSALRKDSTSNRLLYHPILPLIMQNPSSSDDLSVVSNTILVSSTGHDEDALHELKTGKKCSRANRAKFDRAYERVQLIRLMIDPVCGLSWERKICISADTNTDDAQQSIVYEYEYQQKPKYSLFYLKRNCLITSVSNTHANGTSSSTMSESFALIDAAAFYGDVESLHFLLPHLGKYLDTEIKQDKEWYREYWSDLLWRTLLCADAKACTRYETCVRMLRSFYVSHITAAQLPMVIPSFFRRDGDGGGCITSSISSIDLAAIKEMPALSVELFDQVIATAAAAALHGAASASDIQSSNNDTVDCSFAMNQLKCCTSVVSLVALAMQSIRDSHQQPSFTYTNSLLLKAFQSLVSSLYAPCKHRSFSLVEAFQLASDSMLGKTAFVREIEHFANSWATWVQHHCLPSQLNDGQQWVVDVKNRFASAFSSVQISSSQVKIEEIQLLADVHHFQSRFNSLSSQLQQSLEIPSYPHWSLLDLSIVINDGGLFIKQIELDFPRNVKPSTSVMTSSSSQSRLMDQSQSEWSHFESIMTFLLTLNRIDLLKAFLSYFEAFEPLPIGCWWMKIALVPNDTTGIRHLLQRWLKILFAKNSTIVPEVLQLVLDAFLVPLIRFGANIADTNNTDPEDLEEIQRSWIAQLVEEDILPFLVTKPSYRDSYLVLLLDNLWKGCSSPSTTAKVKSSGYILNKQHGYLRDMLSSYRQPIHDHDAFSPLLHMWVRSRQVQLVRFWLHFIAADIQLQDHAGYSALDTSIGTGDSEITRLMKPLLPIFLKKAMHRLTRALHNMRLRRVISRSEAYLAQFDQQPRTSPPTMLASRGEHAGTATNTNSNDPSHSYDTTLSTLSV